MSCLENVPVCECGTLKVMDVTVLLVFVLSLMSVFPVSF